MGQDSKATDELFIHLLEFARANLHTSIYNSDLIQHAVDVGFLKTTSPSQLDKDSEEFIHESNRHHLVNLFIREKFNNGGRHEKKGSAQILKTDSFFNLLEYEELRDARMASTQARKYSIAAISISVLSLIVSTFLGIQQVNGRIQIDQPIEVSAPQLKEISIKLEKIGNKVDSVHLVNQNFLQKMILSTIKKESENGSKSKNNLEQN